VQEKNAKNNLRIANGSVRNIVEHFHINVNYKNIKIINQEHNVAKKNIFALEKNVKTE